MAPAGATGYNAPNGAQAKERPMTDTGLQKLAYALLLLLTVYVTISGAF
ncbi:hypothetical protein IV417_02090 [Alphaproteobacteria bacterium KMM 3653]|uniref:Uncharacterized protein n=1 Tax=Harenicola maris TaxID=2841044 RepID=A0AAP2CKL6_9RHOB|nr:hypothetical protein [Harenicola maris]